LTAPFATWGRATNAASPRSATRPRRIIGDSEIADRLEQRLCAGSDDLRKDRRELGLGVAPQRRDHLGPDQLGWDSFGMDGARDVGLHLRERRSGLDWAVPDEAEPPASGREVVKGAGHRIAEDVLAIEEAPSEAVEDGGMSGGRERRFLDHAAPADVASVDEIDIGEHLAPHGRANAIRADEHLGPDLRTVDKAGGHAVMIFDEAGEGGAVANAILGKGGRQHRVESTPRGAKLRHAKLANNASIGGKGRAAADGDADAAVDLRAGRQQPLQHRRMHAEPGASTLEPSSAPLGDRHVPAGTHKNIAREEAAKGTADDDRAPHVVSRVMEGETFDATMPCLIARRQAPEGAEKNPPTLPRPGAGGALRTPAPRNAS
jgi:hypothetical protein